MMVMMKRKRRKAGCALFSRIENLVSSSQSWQWGWADNAQAASLHKHAMEHCFSRSCPMSVPVARDKLPTHLDPAKVEFGPDLATKGR